MVGPYLIAVDTQGGDSLRDLPRLHRRELSDGRQAGVLGKSHWDVIQGIRKAPDSVLHRKKNRTHNSHTRKIQNDAGRRLVR